MSTSAPTPSSQPELRDYLHKLLLDRERLAGAVPALADWALRDATPSEQEITAVRALVRRNDQLIEQLDPADRAAVTRRVRAQLATEIPARFRLATSQPRPTLSPRATRWLSSSGSGPRLGPASPRRPKQWRRHCRPTISAGPRQAKREFEHRITPAAASVSGEAAALAWANAGSPDSPFPIGVLASERVAR